MPTPPRYDAHTLTIQVSPDRPAPAFRPWVLVLVGDTSYRVDLEPDSTSVIGRTDDVELAVKHPSVSRNHARLRVTRDRVEITDLGSRNGTRVNGSRIDGTVRLVSGDVVQVGEAALVVHGQGAAAPRGLLESDAVFARLEQEVYRAQEYQRPLAVAAIAVPDLSRDGTAAWDALAPLDVAGWADERHLMVLFPERDGDEIAARVSRLVEALRGAAPAARSGVASWPDDGLDAASLWATAKAGATGAQRELSVGERTVIVAEPAMARTFELLRRLAASDMPVLIRGETGVGKENAAYAVHAWSKRNSGPFVTVNCAALPETLIESELFGHQAGAFSGATRAREGRLEAADGGTIFLDEVGELTAGAQAKLLRALETRAVSRLGESAERKVDFRVVAATNRDLADEVARGTFRKDLFFRLGAATIALPALRDRPRETPMLARRFLAEACTALDRDPLRLSRAAMRALCRHAWPGNVRELKNAMDYVAAVVTEDTVEPWHLPASILDAVDPEPTTPTTPPPVAASTTPSPSTPSTPGAASTTTVETSPFRPVAEELDELEKRRMAEALAATGGVQIRAAELIGMPRRTFLMKMRKYGLR